MRILTVSASPYLLVRNGRINASILQYLKDQGHEVFTAAWHHDEGYFMPEEGAHWYEVDGERLCPIIPIDPRLEGSTTLYETMKKVHPDVVVTIGDYKDTSFVWEIKAMLPNLFKWVSLLSVDGLPINPNFTSQIEYADFTVCLNKPSFKEIQKISNIEAELLEFGADPKFFGENKSDGSGFMCSCKNAQASNLGAFVKAVGDAPGVRGYLHTNLYDPGEYDVDLLVERYGDGRVDLPDRYVSIKEAISDEELAEEYKRHAFFVDTSVKSACALSMLEAMACGCIPIGPNQGQVGEIIRRFNMFEFLEIPSEIYIGLNEEEFSVISIEGLSRKISELHTWASEHPDKYQQLSQVSQKISQSVSRDLFLSRLGEIVRQITGTASKIVVDTF